MTPLLALATCDKYPDLFDDDQLLIPELQRLGVRARPVVWDDVTVDWNAFDAVVVRSTWDYHSKLPRFLDWLAVLERRAIKVWNPPSVIRGNIDKLYLRELADQGVPIPSTAWIDPATPRRLVDVVSDFNASDEFVLKPTISAGAHHTYRFKRTEAAAHEKALEIVLEKSWAMVQPFIPEVLGEGEWSLLFFGGSFSHAVLKKPATGDYRVQFMFGATTLLQIPPQELVEYAQKILSRLSTPLLYARVDVIRQQGRFLLGELELTEPCLFLGYHPEAPRRLAEAIKLRCASRTSPSRM